MKPNTEKSPGDLRRLAVSQTPMKDSQGIIRIMIMIICFHTVICLKINLTYTKNFQTYLFRPLRKPYHVLSLQVIVDLGVMAIKIHSTYPSAPELDPHHWM